LASALVPEMAEEVCSVRIVLWYAMQLYKSGEAGVDEDAIVGAEVVRAVTVG
jgi:hypothetical protein